VNKIFFILIILFVSLNAKDQFATYLQKEIKTFNNNDINFTKRFENYKKVYKKSLVIYKSNIRTQWPKIDISNSYRWVEYSNNYNCKKIIDYKKQKIYLEAIAKSEKDAQDKILKMFKDLSSYNIKQAYDHDVIENMIAKKLNILRELPNTNQKLIADIFNKNSLKSTREMLIQLVFKQIKFNKNTIYQATIDFPKNAVVIKKQEYQDIVNFCSNKFNISKKLIFAMIYNQTYFNPMAKDKNLAKGLMQVTPTIGTTGYKYITGKNKFLTSSYLYVTKNNILIGTAYLKILYFEKFKMINSFKSRLYCTIVAYKIGVNKVLKCFNQDINTLTSDQVYKRLMKKLPNFTIKQYLFNVNRYMFSNYNSK